MSPDAPDIREILAGCAGFDWDAGNVPKVRARHKVEPDECGLVFFQELLVVAWGERHGGIELRWYALGRTLGDRKLYLVYRAGPLIRVIAARGHDSEGAAAL